MEELGFSSPCPPETRSAESPAQPGWGRSLCSQRGLRMGQRPIWGSKFALARNNILPPAKKLLHQSSLLLPGPCIRQPRGAALFARLGRQQVTKYSPQSPRTAPAGKTAGHAALTSEQGARRCPCPASRVGKAERSRIWSGTRRYAELRAAPAAPHHRGLCLPSQLPPCQMQTRSSGEQQSEEFG